MSQQEKVLYLVILIVVIILGYFFFHSRKVQLTPTPTPTPSVETVDMRQKAYLDMMTQNCHDENGELVFCKG